MQNTESSWQGHTASGRASPASTKSATAARGTATAASWHKCCTSRAQQSSQTCIRQNTFASSMFRCPRRTFSRPLIWLFSKDDDLASRCRIVSSIQYLLIFNFMQFSLHVCNSSKYANARSLWCFVIDCDWYCLSSQGRTSKKFVPEVLRTSVIELFCAQILRRTQVRGDMNDLWIMHFNSLQIL